MASLAEIPLNMLAQDVNTGFEDPWAEGGPYAPYLARDQSRQSTGFSTHESPLDQYQQAGVNEQYFPGTVTSQEAFSSMLAFSTTPRQPFLETPQLVLDGPQDSQFHKTDLHTSQRTSPDPAASYPFEQRSSTQSSSASAASVASATSSNLGSPYHGALPLIQDAESWTDPNPSIVQPDGFDQSQLLPAGMEFDMMFANPKSANGYVDPSLIQPTFTTIPISQGMIPMNEATALFAAQHTPRFQPPSPIPSEGSIRSHRAGSVNIKTGSESPYLHTRSFHPYQGYSDLRRPSIGSAHSGLSSRGSHGSPRAGSHESDDEGKEKGRCPNPECGKVLKDLKAHMLTHLSERPEKCPIVTCAYHQKGFARKYDKNRHTLTHYRGTLVCGFCPGPGSALEKSFNRADVFKRHLTAVHGVEQTAPNSRKKNPVGSNFGSKSNLTGYAPDATGKCSTCSIMFTNAQDFYEHLDDCVLRVVQQEEPSEGFNEKNLATTFDDKDVEQTMKNHGLPTEYPTATCVTGDNDDDEAEAEAEDDLDDDWSSSNPSTSRKSVSGRSGKGAFLPGDGKAGLNSH